MKKIASILLFLFGFISCNAQNNNTITNQKFDKIVQKYVDNHDFIGSVLVANNGNILLSKGYGYADIENKTQNTPSTNYFGCWTTALLCQDIFRTILTAKTSQSNI
jgi:CubicO group peptidase (beta-lactamase class C family)